MGILAHAQIDRSYADVQVLEQAALTAVRAWANRTVPIDAAMKHIERYDLAQTRKSEIAGSRARRLDQYRRTLLDRPWERCDCAVCRDVGVEVRDLPPQ